MVDKIPCPNCGALINAHVKFCPKCGEKIRIQEFNGDDFNDLYKILQVDSSAESVVIEAAYKRLAAKYHPDVNKSPDAQSKMQEINKAYQVLSKEESRQQYDLVRESRAVDYRAQNQEKTVEPETDEEFYRKAEEGYERYKNTQKEGGNVRKEKARKREIEYTDKEKGESEKSKQAANKSLSWIIIVLLGFVGVAGVIGLLGILGIFLLGTENNNLSTGLTQTAQARPLPSVTPKSNTLNKMPRLESDIDKTIDILNNGEWYYLRDLTSREYIFQDKPGNQTYSITLKEEKNIFLSYLWCAIDRDVLNDNLKHFNFSIIVNGNEISIEQLHALESEIPKGEIDDYPEGLICHEYGVLTSDWPIGSNRVVEKYTLNESINDGYDSYEAGDYIDEFTIIVPRTISSPTSTNYHCTLWNEVTKEQVDSSICSYGIIAEPKILFDEGTGDITYQIVFDQDDPYSYVINVTEESKGLKFVDLKTGDCIMARGHIQFEGNHLFTTAIEIDYCPPGLKP